MMALMLHDNYVANLGLQKQLQHLKLACYLVTMKKRFGSGRRISLSTRGSSRNIADANILATLSLTTKSTETKLLSGFDPIDLMRKYFRKVREYERAYREGHTAGPEVEEALQVASSCV